MALKLLRIFLEILREYGTPQGQGDDPGHPENAED
jgi:hypothetical protein